MLSLQALLGCLRILLSQYVMLSQMLPFIRPSLSDLLCGFREGYSTQHALIRLVENCRAGLDNKNIVGMVLMDLS